MNEFDEAIVERLEQLNVDANPPGNWEASVWAQIAQSRAPSPWRWLWFLIPAAGALAAALLLWPTASVTYTLETRAGNQLIRGMKTTGLRFQAGTRFEFILRPAESLSSPPILTATRTQGDRRIPWTPPAEFDSKGAIRITGLVGPDLPAEPGLWRLDFKIDQGDTSQHLHLDLVIE